MTMAKELDVEKFCNVIEGRSKVQILVLFLEHYK